MVGPRTSFWHGMVLLATAHVFMCHQIKQLPPKEECKVNEVCRVTFPTHPIRQAQFCECPDKQRCPPVTDLNATVVIQNVPYQFCHTPSLRACERGEQTWSRIGFRMFAHCLCHEPLSFVNTNWDPYRDLIVYSCDEMPQCPGVNATCRLRMRVDIGTRVAAHVRGLCHCEEGLTCRQTEETVAQAGDRTDDVWRCLPP